MLAFIVSIIGIIIILNTNLSTVDINSVLKGENIICPSFKEWENPQIFEIKRDAAHAHFIPFESKNIKCFAHP